MNFITCQVCDGVSSTKGLWSHFWWLNKPLVPLLQHNWCTRDTQLPYKNIWRVGQDVIGVSQNELHSSHFTMGQTHTSVIIMRSKLVGIYNKSVYSWWHSLIFYDIFKHDDFQGMIPVVAWCVTFARPLWSKHVMLCCAPTYSSAQVL